MASRLDDQALAQLLSTARTHRSWSAAEVPDTLLEELTTLMQWGPTANNLLPARLVYVKSPAAKERLKPHLSPGNVDKAMSAPVTAVIGHDLSFFEHVPPGQPPATGFVDKPEAAATSALRNGSLQGAYLMLAARALGLDVGPMSGFDNAGVDAEFFAGTTTRSNFLCNLGYGDGTGLRPRARRFAFADIAQIL
ncbi:MAG: malonic semialdehyde reductase [Hyphomicrobiaceae bacterium]|nr:malonic semialdehyde reductase [Hyphomicrobiaceae bacterium]